MHALTRREMLLSAIGLGVFATIVALAFSAYADPELIQWLFAQRKSHR